MSDGFPTRSCLPSVIIFSNISDAKYDAHIEGSSDLNSQNEII